MILAEIIRALTACANGERYFEGCNLLLQLWDTKHFYKQDNWVDILSGMGNKIFGHPMRIKHFLPHVGTEDWFTFLRGLSRNQIQWSYRLLRPGHVMVRGHEL